jgi:hypothetical protein
VQGTQVRVRVAARPRSAISKPFGPPKPAVTNVMS